MNNGSNFNSQLGENFLIIDNTVVRWKLISFKKPIIYAFSNAAERLKDESEASKYLPWGFSAISKMGFNVVSFASIGKATWYRSPTLWDFLHFISLKNNRFPERLTYGASMGGYAATAFAELLNTDRVLAFNPISTLNNEKVPWETRFKQPAKNFCWDSHYSDGAVSKVPGYIIYDPLYNLDALHAKRYSSLTALKFPGVGHGFPYHLYKIGFLKQFLIQFIQNKVDEAYFLKRARDRRNYRRYYKWMLSSENIHLTSKRASIIENYARLFEVRSNARVTLSRDQFRELRASVSSITDDSLRLKIESILNQKDIISL